MRKIVVVSIILVEIVSRVFAQPLTTRYAELPAFYPLKYGNVQPSGWLRDWCLMAKNGLVSHNEAFKEGWINGQPPTFLNEQSAYWIDGMMRLGLVLQDKDLISKASADISSVISHNYLKPSSWATAVYGRAVLAYYYGTADKKALDYLSDFFENANVYGFTDVVDMKPPNDPRGKFLAATQPRNLVQTEAMLETYALTGNKKILGKALEGLDAYAPRYVAHWTGSNMEHRNDKGCYAGLDSTIFDSLPPYKDAFMACLSTMHGVSFNEFAKLWAIGYLFNGNKDYLKASVKAYAGIDSLHMMPYGVNSSWENLMGSSPELGTETCDISDFINSNIWLYRITGNSSYGDKIEKAFFNAAAGAVDHDFTHLAYLQSANHISLEDKFEFRTVHEPKCCNGNSARLLPNYILHMAMATNDHGIALNMYGPSKVNTSVGGKVIAFETITDYPFKDIITVKFTQEKRTAFPLYLRVPFWSDGFELWINRKRVYEKAVNGFVKIEREWKANDYVTLKLRGKARLVEGVTKSNGAVSSLTFSNIAVAGRKYTTVEYGPLLFALDVSEGNKFNYSIVNDRFQIGRVSPGPRFNWNRAPVTITANVVETDWNNAPVLPDSVKRLTPAVQKIKLVPYGCTSGKRISAFPLLQ